MDASTPVPPIPADSYVDQVLSALTRGDAAALRRLESAASSVAPPLHPTRYVQQHSTLGALIDATARNLRFVRRVLARRLSGPADEI